jgi:hypothetical protein
LAAKRAKKAKQEHATQFVLAQAEVVCEELAA